MIGRVLFLRADIQYVSQMLRCEIPVVLCGACGKGVCLPIVNQACSANCGAYVCEVIHDGIATPEGQLAEARLRVLADREEAPSNTQRQLIH